MGPTAGHAGEAPLSAREKELWRAFVRLSDHVISAVERDLFTTAGLSGADFQILARLHEAEKQRLSQKELGELVSWTATRLSHQLARMQKRGLVDRAAAGSGRLMMISITDTGRRTYESILPVHAQSVRTHFLRHLDTASTGTELRFTCDNGGSGN